MDSSAYFNTEIMARTQQNKHFSAGSQVDLTRGLNSSVTQAINLQLLSLVLLFVYSIQ